MRKRGQQISRIVRAGVTSKQQSVLVAAAMLALSVAGCGADEGSSANQPAWSATPPTAQTAQDWQPERTVKYGAKLKTVASPDQTTIDGASSLVRVDMGEITPATADAVDEEFSDLLSNCDIDPAVDAAIPMRTTLTNSSDVEFTPQLTIWLEGLTVTWPGGGAGPVLDIESTSNVEGGAACADVSQAGENSLSVKPLSPQQSGAKQETDWLWIVKDYFAPQFTDGQPAKLSSLGVRFVPTVVGTGTGRASLLPMFQTCFTGDRSFDELWGTVAWGSSNLGFRPYVALGDPEDPESLLTKAELDPKTNSPTSMSKIATTGYEDC